MKAREFIRDHVLPAGGELVRKDGDHHVFRLPNGRTFVVPCGGSQTEVKPYLLVKLRRLLREPKRSVPCSSYPNCERLCEARSKGNGCQ